MTGFGCSGKRPDDIGVSGTTLAPCPSSPNCVSSDADTGDSEHAIAAFGLAAAPAVAWQAAREIVAATERTKIVSATESYLHAESTSRLMRYVDDLELHLRPGAKQIAVRSASRVGRGDGGVNRARVETLREALVAAGVVR